MLIFEKAIIYRWVTRSVLLPLRIFAVSVTLSGSHSEEETARGLERVMIRSRDVSLCASSVFSGMYCLAVFLADSVLVPWRFPPLPVCKVENKYKRTLQMWRQTHRNESSKEKRNMSQVNGQPNLN